MVVVQGDAGPENGMIGRGVVGLVGGHAIFSISIAAPRRAASTP
jgi:hypothetical protein